MNKGMDPSLANGDCACAKWADHQRIGLGSETADLLESSFALERKRNEWLRLVRCLVCGHAWYVAIHPCRLENRYPTAIFDQSRGRQGRSFQRPPRRSGFQEIVGI